MPRSDERYASIPQECIGGSNPQEVSGALGIPQEVVQRRERLAVNSFDLERIDASILQCMQLRDILHCDRPIKMYQDRDDEVGVEFGCDLLQAACMCDLIRGLDARVGRYSTRVYLWRERVWSKLPGNAVLAVVGGDVVALSPRWFAPVDSDIPVPQRIRVNF